MLGSWSEHVDELLYDGERVERRVDLEGATVVVTNDRVLVLTEGGDGPNYRTVERPNVARVSVETEDSLGQLVWATVTSLLAVGVILVAATYDLADAVDGVNVEGTTGISGGALETAETILTVLDLTVLAIGVLLLLIAAALFARYVRSRSRRLVLRVSGGDDITLPVTDADLEADRTVALRDAIGPGSADDDAETDSAGGATLSVETDHGPVGVPGEETDAVGATGGEADAVGVPGEETDAVGPTGTETDATDGREESG